MLDPNYIHLPGIYVDRMVKAERSNFIEVVYLEYYLFQN